MAQWHEDIDWGPDAQQLEAAQPAVRLPSPYGTDLDELHRTRMGHSLESGAHPAWGTELVLGLPSGPASAPHRGFTAPATAGLSLLFLY